MELGRANKVIVSEVALNCDHLLGSFLDERHFDTVINEDCDFYAPAEITLFGDDSESEDKCVFKFRKNFFTEEEQRLAYEGLRDAAVQSQNRGIAAGERSEKLNNREWVTQRQLDILDLMMNPVDSLFEESDLDRLVKNKNESSGGSPRGMVWLSSKTDEFDFEEWAEKTAALPENDRRKEATRISDQYISKTTYANQVYSGVAGWFDRYPRIPYGRATAYTGSQPEKFKKSYPLLQKLAVGFKELMPERYANQEAACAKIDPAFYVPETPFTTLTVNKTFRTAAHLDAGDLEVGFSNLTVLSNGVGYTGGYLVLPEFRVAVNIRPGDLLLVANHSGIHGNTEIKVEEGGERISLVCYFRENMLSLGEKAYEDARYNFIEGRRKNPDHKLWRPLWNGVSPNCFSDSADPKQNWDAAKEWYDYLMDSEPEFLKKYHPWLLQHFKEDYCGMDCSNCFVQCLETSR